MTRKAIRKGWAVTELWCHIQARLGQDDRRPPGAGKKPAISTDSTAVLVALVSLCRKWERFCDEAKTQVQLKSPPSRRRWSGRRRRYSRCGRRPFANSGRRRSRGEAGNLSARPSPQIFASTAAATANPFVDFSGHFRTATGDVNGDGIPDTILVTGQGTPIRVW